MIHLTTTLEGVLRRELELLQMRLRDDVMDDRPFECNMLHARQCAIAWVLAEAGLNPERSTR